MDLEKVKCRKSVKSLPQNALKWPSIHVGWVPNPGCVICLKMPGFISHRQMDVFLEPNTIVKVFPSDCGFCEGGYMEEMIRSVNEELL